MTIPRDLYELLREHSLVRSHNASFGPTDSQETLLMFAEAALILVAFERFLRIVLGEEATEKDTLPNLLEKATSERLAKLKLNAPDRALAIGQLKDVRNTLQHGNYEQAAKQAGLASVTEYFQKIFASEVETLFRVLADLIDQVDPKMAKTMLGVPPRRFVG